MSLLLVLLGLLLPQALTEPPPPPSGLHRPVYAADGRLALATQGDLWMMIPPDSASGNPTVWVPVTGGPAEDQDPAWMPDGQALVFASNRAESFDLWRVEIGPGGIPGPLVQLTQTPEPDTEPTIRSDGAIVFVRGRGADANLWLLTPEGTVEQLTETQGPEYSPALSPDGQHLAYIAERKRRRQLRIRHLSSKTDSLVVGDKPAEHPAWSPEGNRLVFSTRGQQPGVWITDIEGRYTNLVSTARAVAAWTPDGERLALAPLSRKEPAYNGDPDRVGPRRYDTAAPDDRRLLFVRVPPPPDADQTDMLVETTRTVRNTEAFDQLWDRLDAQYTGEAKAQWAALRQQHGPAARAATSEAERADALYALLEDRPPLRTEAQGRAAVSSAHPLATAAGVHILEQGGNVVEAAVAVSFALGVVEPDASGVGGYGEMLIFMQGMDEPVGIEFLTRVPEAASLGNASLLQNGQLPADGPVLANVPGTVAGMEKAWTMYKSGKVAWADLLEPAIALAEDGFVIDDGFATTLAREKTRYLQYESSRALFFPDDIPLQAGDTLRNPDLAWTLRQIAQDSAKAFYKGAIAERMIKDLRGHGNAMTREDLARYYAVEREPVKGVYRGHTVYSGPPPVSGGASLVGKLTLLEQEPYLGPYLNDASTLHSMIEAWKLAPSTSNRIADPGLWPIDLAPFTDKVWAGQRWDDCFDPSRSVTPNDSTCWTDPTIAAAWGADDVLDATTSTGTTAFVVADQEGNMIAVTQTLGTWGGNFYVTPGLGFLYNDKLGSYRTDPQRYNARIPFARNVTSIAPTLVFKGIDDARQPYLALGAAGNAWITSAVYQLVHGVIDQGLSPQQAIELPRFLVGVRREPGNASTVREIVVQVEDGFAPGVLSQLRTMGHDIQRISLRGELRMGYGAIVQVGDADVRAGADPRRSGQAKAVQ